MAGIALSLNRDGQVHQSQGFEHALNRLSQLGTDGLHTHRRGCIALGQANFLVTPEDAGQPLPFVTDNSKTAIAFDGRLDNRNEILAALKPLNHLGVTQHKLADAVIVLESYLCWGMACFQRLHGPIAAIIVDYAKPKVLLYRDPLGTRPLYYYLSQKQLLAASEESVLLTQIDTPATLNKAWIAAYFSFVNAANNDTAFASIKELLPGETLVWTPDNIQLQREATRFGLRPIRYKKDQEYAEHYRELLNQAVASRLRSNGNVGIMLSGGVDSCSLAALAQKQLQANGQNLTVYSWSLADFPVADESHFIKHCAEHLGITLNLIPGEQHWPLKNPGSWPVNLNNPLSNAFLRLILKVYQTAANTGCRVLLNGHFGDNMYPHLNYVLFEMLVDRKLVFFCKQLIRELNRSGIRQWHKNMLLRGLIKHAIGWKSRNGVSQPWLTAEAGQLLTEELLWPPEAMNHPRSDQYCDVLGLYSARSHQWGDSLLHSIRHRTTPSL